MKKKVIALIACMVMICTLIPGVVFAAQQSTMQTGSGGIADGGSVYYGNWNGNALEWKVLDADETNTENPGMFLITKDALGTGEYGDVYFDNTDTKSNAYQGSDAQGWCNTFEGSSLSPKELNAIIKTSKDDGSYSYFAAAQGILNNDQVFFLSAQEAENSNYGFTNNDARKASYKDDVGNVKDAGWWLRSPVSGYASRAGIVYLDGDVHNDYVANAWVARPAFNLNLNSVLFSSAAEGGKSDTVGASGLQQVPTAETGSWKLTLLDTARNNFTAEMTALKNDTATISYENASVGEKEYISAIVTDKDISDPNCNIKYYGRLKNIIADDDKDGTATISLAGKYSDGEKLYIFSEQYNGDKKTDYASALKDKEITFVKKTPAAEEFKFTPPAKLRYDGKEKTATVTPKAGVGGMGEVTVKYYDNAGNELASSPKNVGKYTVKIDVSAGDKYLPATDLTSEEWSFTITKALPAGKDKNKDGKEPGTGDDSNIALWAILALIAALAAAGTVIARKRKQEN